MSIKEMLLEVVIATVVVTVALAIYFMPQTSVDTVEAAPRLFKEINGYRLEYGDSEAIPLAIVPKLRPAAKVGTKKIIAIIDSGFNVDLLKRLNVALCERNNYDPTRGSNTIGNDDVLDHGTRMAYLAATEAQGSNYCIMAIKIFTPDGENIDLMFDKAMKHLLKQPKIDVVSMSFTNAGYRSEETAALQALANKGTKLFAAAGNQNLNLDTNCATYPACYKVKGLEAVGATSDDDGRQKSTYSNYGSVVRVWVHGNKYMNIGTSISTALVAGAYVKSLEAK